MDPVKLWFLDLIAAQLAKTAIPKILVNVILAQIAKQLTGDNLEKFKTDVECFICRHLTDYEKKNPDSKFAALIDALEEMISCTDCKVVAPAAAAVTAAAT